MLVAGDDQVDAVLVEQREPGLADPEVGAVARLRRRQRALVHLHHDHVDRQLPRVEVVARGFCRASFSVLANHVVCWLGVRPPGTSVASGPATSVPVYWLL